MEGEEGKQEVEEEEEMWKRLLVNLSPDEPLPQYMFLARSIQITYPFLLPLSSVRNVS